MSKGLRRRAAENASIVRETLRSEEAGSVFGCPGCKRPGPHRWLRRRFNKGRESAKLTSTNDSALLS